MSMNELLTKAVTGNAGYGLIRGRVLEAVYSLGPDYPPAIGRIAKTYDALADGPRDGRHLLKHGNWRPRKQSPMPDSEFKEHLIYMVQKSRLHVLPPSEWTRHRIIWTGDPAMLPAIQGEEAFAGYVEGRSETLLVNRYERDPRNRRAAIEKHGVRCFGCKLEMRDRYGVIADGFIHIHHTKPISSVGGPQTPHLDDLIPLCPNCHAVVHLQNPPMTVEQIRKAMSAA